MNKVLYDSYGRPLLGLRITVTHKCNFNCIYCHREGENPSEREMAPNEIGKIVEIAAKYGVYKIKLTGGEPLVREDIIEIVKTISKVKGISDLAMTTNGSLLREYAKELAKAGLKRVNVNLPSLNAETYMKITRSKYTPNEIIKGIEEALGAGLNPVKINVVILKGLNENEIEKMIQFAEKHKVILQLIELEPVGVDPKIFNQLHLDLAPIEEKLRSRALRITVRRDMQNRRKYLLPGGAEIEIVKPIENGSFCAACTRIRLTADGKLKPCLMRNDNLVDILSEMRKGAPPEEIEKLFVMAAKRREPYWKTRDMQLKCSI